MIQYSQVQIGDIGDIVTGKTPPTAVSENYGSEFMFIGPTDLHKHFFIDNSEKMISRQGLDSIKGSILNGVSILVGCIGWDMGNVALVNAQCATNQQINSITNIKDEFNSLYIYYWLSFKKSFLFQQANVTRTPILNKTGFSNIEIPIPSKLYQDKVSKVLSDLDAKIELNNKINAELEAMAKTLYDYWFVQFEFPTSAEYAATLGKPNLQGKPYKSSGGKMVYNQELKREIPEGWEVGTLLDIAIYTNGMACQKFRPTNDEFLPVIKIREMRDGFSANTEKVKADIPEKLVVNNGDVLFSWSASLEVMQWSGGKGGLNQHIFKVTSAKYPKSFYYFQLIDYLKHFKMIAELRKTTMGHITQEHLQQSRIVIPPNDIINLLDKILNPIQAEQILIKEQNQQLASLRDWLLPMLMNGQVTIRQAHGSAVKEAEEQVSELGMVAEPRGEYKTKK